MYTCTCSQLLAPDKNFLLYNCYYGIDVNCDYYYIMHYILIVYLLSECQCFMINVQKFCAVFVLNRSNESFSRF